MNIATILASTAAQTFATLILQKSNRVGLRSIGPSKVKSYDQNQFLADFPIVIRM